MLKHASLNLLIAHRYSFQIRVGVYSTVAILVWHTVGTYNMRAVSNIIEGIRS